MEVEYDNRDSHTTTIKVVAGNVYNDIDIDPWEVFHNMLENMPPKEEWDERDWGDVEDMIDTLRNMTI